MKCGNKSYGGSCSRYSWPTYTDKPRAVYTCNEHHKTLWSQGLDTHIKAEDEHADVVTYTNK